jgi:hypothetical protein
VTKPDPDHPPRKPFGRTKAGIKRLARERAFVDAEHVRPYTNPISAMLGEPAPGQSALDKLRMGSDA